MKFRDKKRGVLLGNGIYANSVYYADWGYGNYEVKVIRGNSETFFCEILKVSPSHDTLSSLYKNAWGLGKVIPIYRFSLKRRISY